MTDEQLASFVIGAFTTIRASLPFIKELRERFTHLYRGNYGGGEKIAGCRYWKEFCQKHLHRTDSCIRKAIGRTLEPKVKPPKTEQLRGRLRRIEAAYADLEQRYNAKIQTEQTPPPITDGEKGLLNAYIRGRIPENVQKRLHVRGFTDAEMTTWRRVSRAMIPGYLIAKLFSRGGCFFGWEAAQPTVKLLPERAESLMSRTGEARDERVAA
jgi:hypothetical protein